MAMPLIDHLVNWLILAFYFFAFQKLKSWPKVAHSEEKQSGAADSQKDAKCVSHDETPVGPGKAAITEELEVYGRSNHDVKETFL